MVFGETLSSVVGTNGTELFHKDWRHAAGFVSSPPLRSEDGVQQHMVDLLATYVSTNSIGITNNLSSVGNCYLKYRHIQ